MIVVRVSEYEKNRYQGLADTYANGDLSAWLRHGAMTAKRIRVKSSKAIRSRASLAPSLMG